MKPGKVLFLFAAAALYQMLALPIFRLGPAAPDFVFLVFVYLAFFSPPGPLLILSGACSLVLDLLSLEPLGAHAAGVLPALWLVGKLRGWFIAESPPWRALLVLGAALLSFELRRLYDFLAEGGGASFSASLLSALYTALAGVVVHAFLD
ncbi:MAG: rod shape-determining protein MreD, partial [Planctomycetes bacterium]|nr:rod shape-determining protein MreD [Planctomycetota bacterium]